MNSWKYLQELDKHCFFQSREGNRVGEVTNSELKRWCQNKCVQINGNIVSWDQEVVFPVNSLVLFPKGKRITIL